VRQCWRSFEAKCQRRIAPDPVRIESVADQADHEIQEFLNRSPLQAIGRTLFVMP